MANMSSFQKYDCGFDFGNGQICRNTVLKQPNDNSWILCQSCLSNNGAFARNINTWDSGSSSWNNCTNFVNSSTNNSGTICIPVTNTNSMAENDASYHPINEIDPYCILPGAIPLEVRDAPRAPDNFRYVGYVMLQGKQMDHAKGWLIGQIKQMQRRLDMKMCHPGFHLHCEWPNGTPAIAYEHGREKCMIEDEAHEHILRINVHAPTKSAVHIFNSCKSTIFCFDIRTKSVSPKIEYICLKKVYCYLHAVKNICVQVYGATVMQDLFITNNPEPKPQRM
jgi:hypothetical protein